MASEQCGQLNEESDYNSSYQGPRHLVFEKSGWTNVMMEGMMKADMAHASDTALMKASESVE